VLVSYDLLGLTPNMRPKFVKRFANMFEDGVQATRTYVDEVKNGTFPTVEHSFGAGAAAAAPPPAGTYGPH
jgi:3-methyl-2-oxobutanoate hydroxymethyltransferase